MRQVISKKDLKGRLREGEAPPKEDDYTSKLLKYIPAEVIVLYLTLDSVLRSSQEPHLALQWIIFFFSIVAVVLYLKRLQRVSKWKQITISAVAFIVWIFAIGGPFESLGAYNPLYGAILLPIYTFLIPILEV